MNKNDIYLELKSKILNVELLPNDLITEQELVDKYKVSRTPIREVLMRLQEDKLVEVIPKHGTRVSKISTDFCKTLTFIRSNIEPVVFKEALKHKEEVVKFLEENIKEQKDSCEDIVHFNTLDNLFHKIFFEVCDRMHLYNMLYIDAHDYNRLKILLKRIYIDDLNSKVDEHVAILECFINEDVKTFKKVFKNHIKQVHIDSRNKMSILNNYITN